MALNDAIFRSKLDQLNPSQQSIEGTSAWCLFHRQDARRVAEVWEDYFSKADQAKRLSMVYLANDIVQNGRKKGKEFLEEFFRVLPRALRHLLAKGDDKTKAAVNKVIRVWDERKVFGTGGSKTFAEMVHGTDALTSPRGAAASGSQAQPQQHQAPQHQQQEQHQQQGPPTAAVPPRLTAALQQAAVAAQQTSQLQAAVAAAVPTALGPAAAVEQVAAARGAVQGLGAALQSELAMRQGSAEQLRQLLSQQEGAAAQLAVHLNACAQQLSQLDAKLAQMQQQAAASMAPAPSEQPHGGADGTVTNNTAAAAAAAAGGAAVAGEAAAASYASEAASLAAALAHNNNSAEALLAALMELPRDQQDGLGAELAGMLQSPAGGAGGGDDLYDPEDF